jgi:sensor histidine kinase regulating citrate/malate metabolism
VESLNHSLRAQRHDFLNHLQVVYGLMEMEEYHDAREYIGKVYQDIQKVSRVLKTAIPAVNALLQAKLFDAEKRNIRMEIHVFSRFEHLPVPSWEFCRVLGNLLDNAIAALADKKEDRVLSVKLQEDLKEIIVRVEDNGPMIPKNLLDKIFHPGFTTKKEQGEGMGLAIVKEILEQYGGNIAVDSSESLTAFTVCIPKMAG